MILDLDLHKNVQSIVFNRLNASNALVPLVAPGLKSNCKNTKALYNISIIPKCFTIWICIGNGTHCVWKIYCTCHNSVTFYDWVHFYKLLSFFIIFNSLGTNNALVFQRLVWNQTVKNNRQIYFIAYNSLSKKTKLLKLHAI